LAPLKSHFSHVLSALSFAKCALSNAAACVAIAANSASPTKTFFISNQSIIVVDARQTAAANRHERTIQLT
jgi:predicted glycosyltransferase